MSEGHAMKKHRYLLIVMCCFLAVLGGCSYGIEILVTGDDPFHPEFVLRKPRMTTPLGKTAQLDHLTICVVGESDWKCRERIWDFGFQPGDSKEIDKVEYGIVPDGFEERTQSTPLTAGVTYLVMAGGAGGHGSVRFRIIEKDGSYELKVLEKEESEKRPDETERRL
jgi:hypothetical protein